MTGVQTCALPILNVIGGNQTNASSTGATGAVTIRSGNNLGSGNSGTLTLSTGSAVSGASGAVTISSGAVSAGTANSGDINLSTGTSFGGVRGKIKLQSILNLSTLSAPVSPVDGDIWFDGTNLKIQVGGVTKTVTLV